MAEIRTAARNLQCFCPGAKIHCKSGALVRIHRMGAEDRQPDRSAAERAALVERLFREHNEALIRFLVARLRSPHAAREVAQEAYVRLLSLERPAGAVSYLQSLLFRTAANLATDRLRRDQTFSQIADTPIFHEFADVRTPERAASVAQTVHRLERLLAALPEKCRQAFVLNRVEGLDFASIARIMNLSERMVRTYVERALLHCRKRMDLEEHQG